MTRKPEHYPKWLRDIIFDPFSNGLAYAVSHAERFTDMAKIYHTYRTDARDRLLFDLSIDHERKVIEFEEEIEKLNDRISRLEYNIEDKE